MRLCAPRAWFSLLVLALLLCIIPAFVAGVNAQVPGRNVNIVTGGTFPGGDPSRQKQNEPSIAVSTRNACHLLAGANDYRAVELPGLPDDQEIGDSWVGWYESTDCGATWYSTLVPGYPQDSSPAGLASPVKGLSTGADPVVRSGAAGTFYYLFIAFNRGTNVGTLALARGIDHNDRDPFIDPDKQPISPDGVTNPRRALSPIQYVGTTEIARGSGGRFVDKPNLAVFPAASGTCLIDGETVPATNVYTSWTEFVGNNPENQRSKVYFARSADCGKTLAGPATKLSEGYPLGTGTVIGVNPNNPDDIYVVWRQIRNDKVKDALLFVRSSDGGRSFTKAEFVPGFAEGQFAPFDQATTSTAVGNTTTTFRTNAYPTIAFADDGFLYMAVQQVPGLPTGTLGGANARIVLTRTAGAGWEAPVEVASTGADGQQFMPALAYAAGKLQLVWYDVRFDEAEARRGDALINEKAALANSPHIRRTMDLLGAQASLPSAWPPVFQPYGVSQPDYNDVTISGGRPLRGPRISQYLTGDPLPNTFEGSGPRQLQFNRGNLFLYGGGTIAFMGDYIDIQGAPFVLDAATNKWRLNGLNNKDDATFATFHATWTDNRDAGVGKATTTNGRLDYAKPAPLPPNTTISDVTCPVVNGTEVDNTATRDANVYTSRITNEFSLTLPNNAKPTNTPGVVRAFSVQLANNLELTPGAATPEVPTRFRLNLVAVGASFSHRTFRGAPQAEPGAPGGCDVTPGETPLHQIFVNVLPRSSVARTVFVRCTAAPAVRIVITATRLVFDPGTSTYSDGPSASVAINGDPSNPPSRRADGSLLGPESHNPDAENPDAENPDAENPDAENPDAENPDAENPDAENPDAENPDAENPDAENPDAENPDAENPDAENAAFQDVTVDVTNDGDTTGGYQVNVQTTDDTTGYSFLLMARRVTTSATSINCHLVTKRTNQTLFAIPLTGADLTGVFVDQNAEDVTNPTFLVRPGESIKVTLRIVFDEDATPAFCSTDPDSEDYCFEKLRFKTRAQAPNTGDVEPQEDAEGNVRTVFLSFYSGPSDSLTTDTIPGNEGDIRVTATDGESSVAGVPVTMSLATNPGETSLGGTVTVVTDEAGRAFFPNLRLDTAANGYSLRASAPGAESIVSDEFNIDIASGDVSDSNEDAVLGGGPAPAPELVSATLTVNEGNLYVSVRYAVGTFNTATTKVNVVIDIDEDPATGSPGVDSGCVNDAASMGLDFLINTGGVLDGENVYVYPHAGGTACNSWGPRSNVGTRTIVSAGEFIVGVDLVVPLSALGDDTGRLKFKVLAATSIPTVECPTCSTSVQDYMPNVGFSPGQVPALIILF